MFFFVAEFCLKPEPFYVSIMRFAHQKTFSGKVESQVVKNDLHLYLPRSTHVSIDLKKIPTLYFASFSALLILQL